MRDAPDVEASSGEVDTDAGVSDAILSRSRLKGLPVAPDILQALRGHVDVRSECPARSDKNAVSQSS